MQIELRPIDSIRPYENNPRVNDMAVEAVAASLKEFGFRQPIVVDNEGVIVVGHTRWKAAKKLGLKMVPVHVATDLTPTQAKAYRIADNQTAAIAEWDKELLPIELGELKALDFDLSLLGFEEEELAAFMSGEVTDGQTDPDDVPSMPDAATTKVWRFVGTREPPPALRRQQQGRGCGPAVGRRRGPPGQLRSAVQRPGRAEKQQRHRRRPVVVPVHHPSPAVRCRTASGEGAGDAPTVAPPGPTLGQ